MSRVVCYGLVTFAFAVCVACEDEPARSPNAARPMDEPRAQDVIAKTFQGEGVDAEPNRSFTIASGKTLKLDVAATGKKFGVLWMTRDARRDLQTFLPARSGDALVVLNGVGPDTKAHVLALWDSDYVTDDLANGAEHSETEIAAERKLERDVRDFLVKAKSENWE
jgi:hypothetical protein